MCSVSYQPACGGRTWRGGYTTTAGGVAGGVGRSAGGILGGCGVCSEQMFAEGDTVYVCEPCMSVCVHDSLTDESRVRQAVGGVICTGPD